MNENASTAGGLLALLAIMAICMTIGLVMYIFICFCYKRICEKCGKNPGVLIWIPIAQFIPLLEVARMPVWTIILSFIPVVNLVWMVMLFAKLCVARGKSGWLVILFFIPIANLIILPYLAFSE